MGVTTKYLNRNIWTSSLNIFKKSINCALAQSRTLERIVPDQDEEIDGIFLDSILKPIFLYQISGVDNVDGCRPIEIEKDSEGHDS